MMLTPSQEWSAKITAWQQSGMPLAGWCRENSENYHRFLYWRKRLAVPDPGRFLELTLPAKGFDSGLLADILSVLKRD